MKYVIVLIMMSLLVSCGSQSGKNKKDEIKKDIKNDMPKETPKQKTQDLKPNQTILDFSSVPDRMFGNGFKASKQEDYDVDGAEKLLLYAFDDQKRPTINRVAGRTLDEYDRQFVFAENDKGEKYVWINCFTKSQEPDFKNWKTSLVLVKDGGNNFFNVLINLSGNKYEKFDVNGNG